jgi:hypothetical protein
MRARWVRRGSVSLDQLPDKSPATLRGLSDTDLHRFIAGWEPRTADWIAGDSELKRRQNRLARWALGVSVLSLAVAILALFVNGQS